MTELERHALDLGLVEHREALLALARPTIVLVDGRSPPTTACCKLGGPPDLPASFVWPHHALGPYRFIAQIERDGDFSRIKADAG